VARRYLSYQSALRLVGAAAGVPLVLRSGIVARLGGRVVMGGALLYGLPLPAHSLGLSLLISLCPSNPPAPHGSPTSPHFHRGGTKRLVGFDHHGSCNQSASHPAENKQPTSVPPTGAGMAWQVPRARVGVHRGRRVGVADVRRCATTAPVCSLTRARHLHSRWIHTGCCGWRESSRPARDLSSECVLIVCCWAVCSAAAVRSRHA
jgi:hypothetical protein